MHCANTLIDVLCSSACVCADGSVWMDSTNVGYKQWSYCCGRVLGGTRSRYGNEEPRKHCIVAGGCCHMQCDVRCDVLLISMPHMYCAMLSHVFVCVCMCVFMDQNDSTAVLLAARFGHTAVVEYLNRRGRCGVGTPGKQR